MHPKGRNAMEDRRSRLQRAAASLEGSDRPHRWPNAPTSSRTARWPLKSRQARSWPWRSHPASILAESPACLVILGRGFNRLLPDQHQNGTGSLLHGATYLPKKRCADNRLTRRGGRSLYLAIHQDRCFSQQGSAARSNLLAPTSQSHQQAQKAKISSQIEPLECELGILKQCGQSRRMK